MIQCLGCEKKCRKVSINKATMEEFISDIKNHKCDKPESKSFKVKYLNNRKIKSEFLLTWRDITDIF